MRTVPYANSIEGESKMVQRATVHRIVTQHYSEFFSLSRSCDIASYQLFSVSRSPLHFFNELFFAQYNILWYKFINISIYTEIFVRGSNPILAVFIPGLMNESM